MRVALKSCSKRGLSHLFRAFLLLAVVLVVILAASSCGGGGSSSSTQPPPPVPDFSLAFEQPSLSLQPQGIIQVQVIGATPANGFTGTIVLAASGLPAGVTMTPGSLPDLVITGSGMGIPLQLAASQAAAVGTSTVTITGTSGSITHSASFSLTVKAAAPFTIQVSPASLTLSPALNKTVQVSVIPNPGTSPSLDVQVTQAPPNSGIRIFGPQGLFDPKQSRPDSCGNRCPGATSAKRSDRCYGYR